MRGIDTFNMPKYSHDSSQSPPGPVTSAPTAYLSRSKIYSTITHQGFSGSFVHKIVVISQAIGKAGHYYSLEISNFKRTMVELSTLSTGRLYPRILISVNGWVIMSIKIPMTPSRIDKLTRSPISRPTRIQIPRSLHVSKERSDKISPSRTSLKHFSVFLTRQILSFENVLFQNIIMFTNNNLRSPQKPNNRPHLCPGCVEADIR
jgi:hypothetical protein